MLLFTILKVIGLVLLFLLLLILLLLGLILLVPFRYAGAGHKGEAAKDYAAHIDLCWLLRMVQLHAGLTPAGLTYYLRILCFHPMDSRPPDTPPANASDETSSQDEEEPSTEDTAANVSSETSSRSDETVSLDDVVVYSSDEISTESEEKVPSTDGTETDASGETSSRQTEENMQDASDRAKCQSENVEVDSIELKNCMEPEPEAKEETMVQASDDLTFEDAPGLEEADNKPTSKTDQESEMKSPSPAAEAPKKKKRKKSSFAGRIKKICEKASSLRETVEDEENQKAVRLLISRVKYLLHHLRFRRFEGRLAFGFDDPAMMGRILGVLSLFYPLYGESFTVTPVFDHTVFEGEIALKGHVRLIHILIAAIQLMMNKKIRGLVLDRI